MKTLNTLWLKLLSRNFNLLQEIDGTYRLAVRRMKDGKVQATVYWPWWDIAYVELSGDGSTKMYRKYVEDDDANYWPRWEPLV